MLPPTMLVAAKFLLFATLAAAYGYFLIDGVMLAPVVVTPIFADIRTGFLCLAWLTECIATLGLNTLLLSDRYDRYLGDMSAFDRVTGAFLTCLLAAGVWCVYLLYTFSEFPRDPDPREDRYVHIPRLRRLCRTWAVAAER